MSTKAIFLKLYLTIISAVSLMWVVIWYWVGIYSQLNHIFITNEEYIVWSYNNYEITNCDNNLNYPTKTDEKIENTKKSDEEIAKCKEKAKNDIISKRSFWYKQDVLGWLTWWTIFLIVFLSHFPYFLKQNKKDYS